MLWWPRHTPSTGSLPAKYSIAATEMPASLGELGPGEITMALNAFVSHQRNRLQSSVISSLRTTVTSAPSSPKY